MDGDPWAAFPAVQPEQASGGEWDKYPVVPAPDKLPPPAADGPWNYYRNQGAEPEPTPAPASDGPWTHYQQAAPAAAPPPWEHYRQSAPLPPAKLDEGSGPITADSASPMARPADQGQSQFRADLNAANQGLIGATGQAISGTGEALRGAGAAALEHSAAAIQSGGAQPGDPENEMAAEAEAMGLVSPAQAKQQAASLQAAAADVRDQPALGAQTGQAIQDYAAKNYPVDPANVGMQTKVAGVIGGAVPAVGAAAAGTVLGGPVGGATMGAAVVFPQSYHGTYQEAVAKGATPEQADAAATENAVIQAGIMSAPLGRLFQTLPAPMRDGLAKTLVNLGTHGVEFGSATAMSQFADNYVAKNSFDPDRPYTQGVAEAGTEGTIAGLIVPTAAMVARNTADLVRRGIAPAASPEFTAAQDTLKRLAGQSPDLAPPPALPPPDSAPPSPPPAPPPETPPAAPAPEEISQKPSAQAANPGANPSEEITPPAPVPAEPTPAQAEAGNYAKVHKMVGGLDIAIETAAGQTRTGVAPDGQPWSVQMPVDYGYVKRTEGADGDPVDVFMVPSQSGSATMRTRPVFVIDQVDPATGLFDEHKAMLGFASATDALDAYSRSFSDGSGPQRVGSISAMPFPAFKTWALTGDTTVPAVDAKGAQPVVVPPLPGIQEQSPTSAPPQPPAAAARHTPTPMSISSPSLAGAKNDIGVQGQRPQTPLISAQQAQISAPRPHAELIAVQAEDPGAVGQYRVGPAPDEAAAQRVNSQSPAWLNQATQQSGAPFAMVRPSELTLDPKRFQYKEADDQGVTGALAGVTRWDSNLANPITAYRDTDGKLYVVNGHQRTDLAARADASGQPDVQMSARVLDAADGWSAKQVKALGAYQNIAEGTGTAVDAAKVLRNQVPMPNGRQLPPLPPRSALVQQARGLSALSNEAFGAVVNGVVPSAYAAEVGSQIADPTQQMAAIQVLHRAEPANAEQARVMVQDIAASGFLNGSQDDMFGSQAFAQSLFPERAKVLTQAMSVLRGNKRVFSAALSGEETLIAAGNKLDSQANQKGQTENESLLDALQRGATTRGPLSDLLTSAARQLAANPKNIRAIAGDFIVKARALVRSGTDQSVRHGVGDDRTEPAVVGAAAEGAAEPAVAGQSVFLAAREPGTQTPTNSTGPRDEIAELMRQIMRYAGLPSEVGLRLVDSIRGSKGPAEAKYGRKLITFAMDTAPDDVPAKLTHEIIHALLDPKLGLVTSLERRALDIAGAKFLRQKLQSGKTVGQELTALGYPEDQLVEEAVARLAEHALEDAMRQPPALVRGLKRMVDLVRGLNQLRRGEGFTTADDVFRSIMQGKRAPEPAREALMRAAGLPAPQSGPTPPAPAAAAPNAQPAASQRPSVPDEIARVRTQTPETYRYSLRDQLNASGSLPDGPALFDPDADGERAIHSLRGPLGREVGGAFQAIKDRAYNGYREVVDGLFPMRAGTAIAQTAAFNFANALRGIQYRYSKLDTMLAAQFSPVERTAMGKALDAQSVFEQQLRQNLQQLPEQERSAEATSARAAFDDGRTGVAGLPANQRAVVEGLNELSRLTWQRMQQRGIARPEADGLPYYMPRMFVAVADEGKVSRVKSPASSSGRSAAPSVNGLHAFGRNLTSAGPRGRKYLTPEESTAAARVRFGDGTELVTDIRALLVALSKNERSIAGRDLIDAIKSYGEAANEQWISEGGTPDPRQYFTLADHPSMWKWRVKFDEPDAEGKVKPLLDANGKPVFESVPVHVSKDFEGPLKGVLTAAPGALYRGFMAVKSAVMHGVMFSPFMHLAVEIGRALPAFPGKMLTGRLFVDGHRGLSDDAFMAQAIADGLAPVAQHWSQDPATVMDQNINPYGRNKLTRAIGGSKDAVARNLERFAGRFAGTVVRDPHQALLWRNVLKLQVGIYKNARDAFVAKGIDAKSAGLAAGHIANRYAGALPPENMTRGLNMLANIILFSRSFTLGNLGVMKDALKGAPPHILAAIEAAGGDKAKLLPLLRRKAQAAVALDVGLHVVGNAVLTVMFSTMLHAGSLGLVGAAENAYQEWKAHALTSLASTSSNPLLVAGVWPQHWNEPGKQDRVYAGNDPEGRGIYVRPMTGKVGEEMIGWLTKPNELLANKENPMISGLLDLLPNLHDRWGRALTNQDPKTIGDYLDNAGAIVTHLVGGLLPAQAIRDIAEAATGPDRGMAALRFGAQATGMAQISQGFPGGPRAGEEFAAKKRDDAIEATLWPSVRQAMAVGDYARATSIIHDSEMSSYGQQRAVRSLRYIGAPTRDRRSPTVDWQSVNDASRPLGP
jgi:hypothetical protein